jgi:peptidoglycan/xylan/chitin deacetylase (PgdA/CDA1 family)
MSPPILVLHAVGGPDGRYTLPEEVFHGFLARAVGQGWSLCTLSDLAGRDGRDGTGRTLALTFDDAYESVARVALPALQALGLPATVFVNTEAVGGRNDWNRRAACRLQHCTWDALGRLHDAGWEIGSHTHHHFNLLSLDDAEIRSEVETANALLERHLGVRPRCLAYPYGRFDARVVAAIRPCFDLAVATERGGDDWVRDRWSLRRLWPEATQAAVRALFYPGGDHASGG